MVNSIHILNIHGSKTNPTNNPDYPYLFELMEILNLPTYCKRELKGENHNFVSFHTANF